MSLVAILFGTLPIGKDAWPNIVGILLGFVVIGLFVYGICVPVLSPTGRVDIFTLMYMKYKGEGSGLHVLRDDTARICGGEPETAPEETRALNEANPSESDAPMKKEEGSDVTPPPDADTGVPEGEYSAEAVA